MSSILSQAQTAAFRLRRRAQVMRDEKLFVDSSRAVPGAEAFSGLHHLSLAAASLVLDDSVPRHISIILPEVHPTAMFAGIRTALEIAVGLSNQAGLPLRIFSLSGALKAPDVHLVQTFLRTEFGLENYSTTEVLPISALAGCAVNSDDVWIGTHWTTALPLDIASRLGILRPEQVVYVVQDYEPGFYPWSSDFALARSTYRAGFTTIVNSAPLASYLRSHEPIDVDDALVFAPSLDFDRLREAADARRHSSDLKLLFYGRPSKPRNLFNIGVSALRLVSGSNPPTDLRIASAGESHTPVHLGGRTLVGLGKLSWDQYFVELAASDVVLSLQHSPHPSHPPLDAVASGAIAVTNELEGTRAHLHPRLLTAEPDATALAQRLSDALDMARGSEPAGFDDTFVTALGNPLASVIGRVASSIK